MVDDGMTLERFRQIIDAYGAEPRRWPEAERQAAIELCERSGEASGYADAAARLDGVLDRSRPQMPDSTLVGRILDTSPPRSHGFAGWWRVIFGGIPAWRPLAACVAAGLLGIGLGLAQPSPLPAADAEVIDVVAFSFAINGEDGN